MSGVMFVLAPCFACGQVFTFSPTKVPSIAVNGERQPICEGCVIRVNPLRERNGLDPIVPLPGAYDADPDDGLGEW